MLPSYSQQKPKQPTQRSTANVLETLHDISGGVGKTVVNDVAGKVASDAFASLFGNFPTKQQEMRPNESIPMPRTHEYASPSAHQQESNIARLLSQDQAIVKQQVEAVRQELKALVSSLKQLHQEIGAAVAQDPIEVGVYHLNFYEQLRAFIKMLRLQVEDSRTWLSTHQSRKKKNGYWNKYKKHGTSFGLSNERTLATQTG
jgi:hypothetical protein